MAQSHLSLFLFLAAAGLSAGCEQSSAAPAKTAQAIVDDVAKKHPNVTRLTLHAKPAGGAQLQAVASTAADKRGKPSDPEDQKALDGGQEVVMEEGENLDVTIPLKDAAGKNDCVAGVTVKTAGRARDAVIAEARTVADELNKAVRAAAQPLW
jgi:hypothetical protein